MLLKCAALCDLYNVENTHNVSLQCGKHHISNLTGINMPVLNIV